MKKTKLFSAIFVTAMMVASALTNSAISRNSFDNVDYTQAVAYTNHDAATYYSSIDTTKSGTALLTDLQTLNGQKLQSRVGYGSMPSRFTSTDPGTKSGEVTGFYSGKSATYSGNMNREHTWPASRTVGGRDNDPLEDDIHMTRPTLTSDNSSRGNNFFTKAGTGGWDPGSLGVESYRGDAARIILYCVVADSRLSLVDKATDSASNHTMGKLSDLLEWNLQYPVQEREKTRNEAAESLQGNRNPFIDHPEFGCKIWGNTNDATKRICAGHMDDQTTPGDDDPPVVDPHGLDATDPLTPAEAIAKCSSGSTATYYVKGFVSSIDEVSPKVGDSGYGNATFKISVNGSTESPQLKIFRAKYLNNENFTSTDQLQVGNEVIVCGSLVLYNNEPEMTSGFVYSIDQNADGSNIPGEDEVPPEQGGNEGQGGEQGGNTNPSGEDTNPSNSKLVSIRVTYDGKEGEAIINTGESLSKSKLVVTATYEDGSQADVTSKATFKFEQVNTNVPGTYFLYIEYLNAKAQIMFCVRNAHDGCHGSIIASTALVSITSLLGVGLILIKRKEK